MEPALTGRVTTRRAERTVQLVADQSGQAHSFYLTRLKLYESDGRRWMVAEVQVSFPLYDLIRKQQWFGLTSGSMATEQPQSWTFHSDRPVELTLRLADDVLKTLPGDDTAEGTLAAVAEGLATEGVEAVRLITSWRYLQVVQSTRTVGDTVVKEGFRSRHKP